ncbi:MAG: hypothetical protein HZA95_04300 [Candidatus Vogelbacteria bacterium]|nr:hypothetical protein [Candidatus Vogelbacteria bacterium]
MSMDTQKEISAEEQDVALQIREHLSEVLKRPENSVDVESSLYDDVAELMMAKREVKGLFLTEHEVISSDGDVSEAEIYKKYKLPNIDLTLRKILHKIETLGRIDSFIESNTICPEGIQGEMPARMSEMRSKLKTILYILEKHKIPLDSISFTQGSTTPEMKSGANYITVEIPKLKRLIQICDEGGNVFYIFKSSKMTSTKLNGMTRGEKNDWISDHKHAGERIAYAINWVDRLEKSLFLTKST